MTSNTLNQAKALLLDTFFLRKIYLNLNFRYNEKEPEYPERFWRVMYYHGFEKRDWDLVHSFDVDTLEEAIAHGILGTKSEIHYETCDLPNNLKKHWKHYSIIVEEHVNRKTKWGELREDVRAGTQYKIKTDDGWKDDFSEGAWKLETALAFIPHRYYKMIEGGIPFHWDYHNVDKLDVSAYPMFRYQGHYFKTDHFIPDQKCVCGYSETYNNDYEHDHSVKVEVWDAHMFEEDVIHYDQGNIIYNGVILPCDSEMKRDLEGYAKDEMIDRLRNMYPDAKGYNGDMESKSFGTKEWKQKKYSV
jgi:hypothetical protein